MEPEAAVPVGMERRIVSVLFADLVGFTSLSEALDAEDVAAVQDAYFAGIRDAVGRHGGRLEKFIGDAAVAAFGADRTREDDAERAVRAGLAIVALVSSLGARLGLDEDALDVRVGIQTGEVAVATDGPDAGRLTGDTMNTAARLQAAAAPGTVLCGRPVVLAAAHAIGFAPAALFPLKGKAEPVTAAVAEGPLPEVSRAAAMGALAAGLVGREGELETLGTALMRVAAGGAERWTVIADPGVGKSRLLAALRELAETAGAAVWTTRLRSGEVAPFAAAAALVRSALGDEAVDGPRLLARLTGAGIPPDRAEVLAAEASGLLEGSVAAVGAASDLAAERSSRFGAWTDLLDTLAAGRPQVWLIEDVHWAGGDLLAFLALAGATGPPSGRLVVATARPTLVEHAPGWADAAGGHRLELGPLGEQEGAALVRALVGEALPNHLVTAIVTRADGNPLFIEELLRSWVSLGIVARDVASVGGADTWRLTVEPDEVPMPETVQALYAAQLDDLPPAAREVARRASVAGRRFAAQVLGELGLPDGPVRDGLAVLLRGSLVDGPREDATLGPGYGYRHALLRDAGYASLARAERVRLHLAVARWMEGMPGARDALAEPIGRQLAAAAASMSAVATAVVAPGDDRVSRREQAARWLTLAADHALALAAHDAAATQLREAIALSDPAAELALAQRTARLGEVLASTGGAEEAAERLADACSRFEALLGGNDAESARIGYAAAAAAAVRVRLDQLRFADGQAFAAAAVAVLEAGGARDDAPLRRLALIRAQADLFATNEPGPASAVARSVEAYARSTGDRDLELDALRLFTAAMGDEEADDVAVLDRVAALAEELQRWPAVVTARTNQAIARLGDRTAEVVPLLDEAELLARSRALPHHLAWIAQCRAETGLLLGDWDDALRHGRAALDIAVSHGYHRAAVRTWFVLRPIARLRGDAPLLEEMGAWMAARTDLPDSPYGRLMHAAVDHAVGDASGETTDPPDASRLREAWALGYGDPSFVAGRDGVLQAWWAAGWFDEIAEALAASPEGDAPGPLASGALLLWRARMGRNESDTVALAQSALERLRRWDAAWWIEQAIAVLDDAGAATPDDRAERRAIRVRLLGTPTG